MTINPEADMNGIKTNLSKGHQLSGQTWEKDKSVYIEHIVLCNLFFNSSSHVFIISSEWSGLWSEHTSTEMESCSSLFCSFYTSICHLACVVPAPCDVVLLRA